MSYVSIGPTPSVNVALRDALGIPALEAAIAAKADLSVLNAHVGNISNPHGTSAVQVNAYTTQQTDTAINALSTALNASLTAHANDLTNPHQVTKAQIGLSAVDNTSDANKPISNAQAAAFAALSDAVNALANAANTSTFLALSADPQPINIPAGTIRVAKNTTTGRLTLWANDGGTMVDLLTIPVV